MYLVDGDSLQCYGWENGERLVLIRDMSVEHGLPEKFLLVFNVDRNENGGVLESQIKPSLYSTVQ